MFTLCPVQGRDTDAALVQVPGGRQTRDWGSSSSSSDEEPPRKRGRRQAAAPRAASNSSGPSAQSTSSLSHRAAESPERDSLEQRYSRLVNMPECRLTAAERAEVRQILVLQLLKQQLRNGGQADLHDIILMS